MQGVYDSKLIAMKKNTFKSKGKSNRNNEIRQGNTMCETPKRDHSNEVLASDRSIGLSMSSKFWALRERIIIPFSVSESFKLILQFLFLFLDGLFNF